MIGEVYLSLLHRLYPGFSKRNTTSVQAPILRKRILLADKSDDYVLYHIAIAKFGNCCSMLVFPFQRRWQRSYVLFCDVFTDVIFYPHVQLQRVENYPSATVLRPLKSDF